MIAILGENHTILEIDNSVLLIWGGTFQLLLIFVCFYLKHEKYKSKCWHFVKLRQGWAGDGGERPHPNVLLN